MELPAQLQLAGRPLLLRAGFKRYNDSETLMYSRWIFDVFILAGRRISVQQNLIVV